MERRELQACRYSVRRWPNHDTGQSYNHKGHPPCTFCRILWADGAVGFWTSSDAGNTWESYILRSVCLILRTTVTWLWEAAASLLRVVWCTVQVTDPALNPAWQPEETGNGEWKQCNRRRMCMSVFKELKFLHKKQNQRFTMRQTFLYVLHMSGPCMLLKIVLRSKTQCVFSQQWVSVHVEVSLSAPHWCTADKKPLKALLFP